MLTIFEYLRQRAFESILAGVQEALELLESQAAFGKVTNPAPPDSNQAPPAALDQGADEVTEDSDDIKPAANTAGPTGNSGELLPAPRLRGRARRKGARKR